MIDLLDKLLKKLPGDGWKTQVGFLLQLLPVVVPALSVPAKDVVEKVGQAVLALGVLHKAIKEIRK